MTEIQVKGLFGCYDHGIELSDEGLTFIHSLNGVGKSTTLRLIADLFRGDRDAVLSVEFQTLSVTFDDSSVLTVKGWGQVTYSKNGRVNEIDFRKASKLYDVKYISPDRNMHYIFGDKLAIPTMEFNIMEFNRRADIGMVNLDDARYFVEIINRFYSNKKVYLDDQKHLKVRLEDKMDFDIKKMSSGEKQIFIMFYCIVFAAANGSMVIIDEPEISLHVGWQQKLGAAFLDVCEYKNIEILVATHSPMVIHDRWDLARELRYERA